MEPITLVLTAISSAVTAAAKDTVSQAVKSASASLKSLIMNHFKGKKDAEIALERFEEDPETWRKPFEKMIGETRVGEDPNVIATAQLVMRLIHPEQHAQGKFNIRTTGPVQGQQIGDFGNQQNAFGAPPKS